MSSPLERLHNYNTNSRFIAIPPPVCSVSSTQFNGRPAFIGTVTYQNWTETSRPRVNKKKAMQCAASKVCVKLGILESELPFDEESEFFAGKRIYILKAKALHGAERMPQELSETLLKRIAQMGHAHERENMYYCSDRQLYSSKNQEAKRTALYQVSLEAYMYRDDSELDHILHLCNSIRYMLYNTPWSLTCLSEMFSSEFPPASRRTCASQPAYLVTVRDQNRHHRPITFIDVVEFIQESVEKNLFACNSFIYPETNTLFKNMNKNIAAEVRTIPLFYRDARELGTLSRLATFASHVLGGTHMNPVGKEVVKNTPWRLFLYSAEEDLLRKS